MFDLAGPPPAIIRPSPELAAADVDLGRLGLPRHVRRAIVAELARVCDAPRAVIRATADDLARYAGDPLLAMPLLTVGTGRGLLRHPKGHRYWRSLKTNSAGTGNYFAEVELFDGVGSQISLAGLAAGDITGFGLVNLNTTGIRDGDLTTPGAGFHVDSSPVGAWFKLDLGTDYAVRTWKYWTTGTVVAIWDIQYSDDNSFWTAVYTGLDCSGSAGAKTATW